MNEWREKKPQEWRSVVLVNFQDTGRTCVTVVMGHAVEAVEILKEGGPEMEERLSSLFMPTGHHGLTKQELQHRKDSLRVWLEKNRIPVVEEGETLRVAGVLSVDPPYGPQDCSSSNEIILSRVQSLVQNNPLQAKAVELKEGLTGAMEDLSTLQQKGICLEERIVTYQNEMDGKILDIRNCLSSFEVSFLLKGTEEDCSEDDRKCFSSQTVSSIIQNLPDSLPQLSTVSTQMENQNAAMELLESERVYVSYLSLLLNANIAFNGNEAIHIKDKRTQTHLQYRMTSVRAVHWVTAALFTLFFLCRPFPSSLRFLIQQHLKLLHTLQERVLKCQWQGIIGDVFLRLTNKESDFLDHYVTYLKELPKCLSAINMYSSSSMETAGLFENLLKQTDAEHPDYYALLISIEQLKAFTSHFSPVLQYSKELLLGGRMEVRRSEPIFGDPVIVHELYTNSENVDVPTTWAIRALA
ncbi:hypothetical protein Z043_100095 [Scleropages formosus]|uniref:Uncharacterized protein n=1 Tax=Scleropages formosus TaxID=113540 RepID=A0A0P7ZGV4_SCLFO|nr:hypothetical protein Z043_100095 [Scleropages formosus]